MKLKIARQKMKPERFNSFHLVHNCKADYIKNNHKFIHRIKTNQNVLTLEVQI